VAGAIGASAALSALKLEAKVIVCLTTTGLTANMISGYRPKARIIAVTDNLATLNRLDWCGAFSVCQFSLIPVLKMWFLKLKDI